MTSSVRQYIANIKGDGGHSLKIPVIAYSTSLLQFQYKKVRARLLIRHYEVSNAGSMPYDNHHLGWSCAEERFSDGRGQFCQ